MRSEPAIDSCDDRPNSARKDLTVTLFHSQSLPALQQDFNAETKFLREHRIFGDSHVLGPISQDHYYFFAADNIHRPDGLPATQEVDQDLILNMHDIDPRCSKYFWHPSMGQVEGMPSGMEGGSQEHREWVTKASGIRGDFPYLLEKS